MPRRLALALSLLTACNLSTYDGSAGQSSSTTGGSSGSSSGSTDSSSGASGIITSSSSGTDDPTTGVTTTAATTGTSGGTTHDHTTGGPTTDATDATGSTSSTTGMMDLGKQETWGHPCATDDDCMALVGDKGVCIFDVLGLYELPGGYCTKGCSLPDLQTMYIPDDPICGPGVTCIGAMGYFEACAIECTDNSECPFDGYECRTLPVIGMPGDPKFCLMTEDHKL